MFDARARIPSRSRGREASGRSSDLDDDRHDERPPLGALEDQLREALVDVLADQLLVGHALRAELVEQGVERLGALVQDVLETLVVVQEAAGDELRLRHELAHVFAAELGDRTFGISLRGIIPNIGLIEGIAVAADWHGAPLTPHQAVAALIAAGATPNVAALLSPRFFGVNAEQAYNVAGSFCRFLIDTY